MGILLDGNSWIKSTTNYTRTATDHTVMYWARLDDNSAVRRPFGSTGNWEARTGAGNSTLTDDYLQSGTGATPVLTVGQWHHVTFVIDVTGARREAFVDGVSVSVVDPATFAGEQVGLMSIGVTAGGSTQGWVGALDDARVYNRILEDGEIETIANTYGRDGIHDTECWFPMDEGAEGAAVVQLDEITNNQLIMTSITGTPTYDYSAGITYRRMAG